MSHLATAAELSCLDEVTIATKLSQSTNKKLAAVNYKKVSENEWNSLIQDISKNFSETLNNSAWKEIGHKVKVDQLDFPVVFFDDYSSLENKTIAGIYVELLDAKKRIEIKTFSGKVLGSPKITNKNFAKIKISDGTETQEVMVPGIISIFELQSDVAKVNKIQKYAFDTFENQQKTIKKIAKDIEAKYGSNSDWEEVPKNFMGRKWLGDAKIFEKKTIAGYSVFSDDSIVVFEGEVSLLIPGVEKIPGTDIPFYNAFINTGNPSESLFISLPGASSLYVKK